jgi:K+-sensing histidine kinase KdpD
MWGGVKAGLFSLLLTVTAINYFFIPPLHRLTLTVNDLIRLGVFGLVLLVGFYFRRHLTTGQRAQ